MMGSIVITVMMLLIAVAYIVQPLVTGHGCEENGEPSKQSQPSPAETRRRLEEEITRNREG